MLDSNGFDLWSGEYDKAVGLSESQNTYPFAGYKNVLGEIYSRIMERPRSAVLDLGFGTATLTGKLYENGNTIYGQDFSKAMIETASKKMPKSHLYHGDFAEGLVPPLREKNFDFIVATYSFHHVPYEKKIPFLRELFDRLNKGGKIFIGDIAFETREEMARVAKEVGDEWDDEEYYSIYEELKEAFPALTFERISFCAAIMTLTKE